MMFPGQPQIVKARAAGSPGLQFAHAFSVPKHALLSISHSTQTDRLRNHSSFQRPLRKAPMSLIGLIGGSINPFGSINGRSSVGIRYKQAQLRLSPIPG